jgi:hypothetical protein
MPAPDLEIVQAYKAMRSSGDGNLQPVLKRLVSHIGWEGFPGLWSAVDKLSHSAMPGILEDEGLGQVPDAIERASEETFHNARLLLKRIRVDMFGNKDVIRSITEALAEDGMRTEAILREYAQRAFSPSCIFGPFLGLLRVLHSGGDAAWGLLEMLKKVEDPSTNAKVAHVLSDPEAVRRVLRDLKGSGEHR